jgi:hypothetical protein
LILGPILKIKGVGILDSRSVENLVGTTLPDFPITLLTSFGIGFAPSFNINSVRCCAFGDNPGDYRHFVINVKNVDGAVFNRNDMLWNSQAELVQGLAEYKGFSFPTFAMSERSDVIEWNQEYWKNSKNPDLAETLEFILAKPCPPLPIKRAADVVSLLFSEIVPLLFAND